MGLRSRFRVNHNGTWMFLAPAIWLVDFVLARLLLAQPGLPAWLRSAAFLLPIPAFLLFFFVFLRFIRGMDELQRRIQLEALIVAFPLTVILLMMLGLSELLGPGTPFISMRDAWLAPPAFYGLGLFIARRRYQ